MTPSPLIRLERADLGHGRRTVLREVSLIFRLGESVGLVGPNGSGKTTFLRTVLGLLPPLAGVVERDLSRRFAYVPQAEELNLLWPLTVGEAVETSLRARRAFGRLAPGQAEAARSAMERTGVFSIRHRPLRDVSGGQRQRAALAQALCQGPDVLLLDEPTRGLDVVAERDLLAIIDALRSGGLTVLIVSHSLHVPLNFTDRLLLFQDGAVVAATPREIMDGKKLEEVYGVPFLRGERDGLKWVMPAGGSAGRAA